MQEGRRLQAFQLDAYHKGSEMKQAHMQARRVLQGTELLALGGGLRPPVALQGAAALLGDDGPA
jgi:hypothetical protein